METPPSLTWPRSRRITRRQEYEACYDSGKRCRTKHFVVFVRTPETASQGRLGLAVTKKCGNAVERNRIKRVLRSFFRLHQGEMPPLDLVVTPKKHLHAASFGLALAEKELLPLLAELSAPPSDCPSSAAPAQRGASLEKPSPVAADGARPRASHSTLRPEVPIASDGTRPFQKSDSSLHREEKGGSSLFSMEADPPILRKGEGIFPIPHEIARSRKGAVPSDPSGETA